jgi:hypothetical protein
MAEAAEEPKSPAPQQPQAAANAVPKPLSPPLSGPEELATESSTSRSSQRPTGSAVSTTPPSTNSPAPTLANNPDYVALQSSLTVLNAQYRQASEDMHTLLSLKQKALSNPAWFKQILLTGQLGKLVPRKQNIVRCPRVEWEKYGPLGLRLGRQVDKPAPVEPLYKVIITLQWLRVECTDISTFAGQKG